MAFIKTLIVASMAAVAFAVPQSGASDGNKKVEIDSKTSENACGNGSKVACCNSGEDLIGLLEDAGLLLDVGGGQRPVDQRLELLTLVAAEVLAAGTG